MNEYTTNQNLADKTGNVLAKCEFCGRRFMTEEGGELRKDGMLVSRCAHCKNVEAKNNCGEDTWEELKDKIFQLVMEDIGKRYRVSDTLSDVLSDSLSEHLSILRHEIDLAVKRREGELREELVMRIGDMTKNPLLTQSGEGAGIEAELDSLKRFILSLPTHKGRD